MNKKEKKKKKKQEFSKWLLVQESALLWITTISLLGLAYVCVLRESYSDLPWVAAMAGFPWTAYGVSQAFYYRKATKENTKDGIKYETVMSEYNNNSIYPDDGDL